MKKIILMFVVMLSLLSHSVFSACGVPDVNRFGTSNRASTSTTVYWRSVTSAISYNLKWRVRTPAGTWNTPVAVSGIQYSIGGLTASTNYEFQVQTVCASGTSAFSSSGWFTTLAGSSTCASVPDVSRFATTNKTSTSATTSWYATSGAASYNLKWRVRTPVGTWNSPVLVQGLQYNITGLNPSTNYEFQVQTNCTSGGASAFSSSGWFTTLAGTSSCGSPANLIPSNISSSGAVVSWSTVSGATSYNCQYRPTGGAWTTFNTVSTTSTLVLSPNTSYEFQVQSVCGTTTSSFSAVTFATPVVSTSNAVPLYDKVVVVVFENTSFPTIVNGYGTLTAFRQIADEGALFTESYGMDRPSQPNYFDLFTGSDQGWLSNTIPTGTPFSTPNIGAAVRAAGKTFTSYCQGLPAAGSTVDVSGNYARKHNYVASWQGTGTNMLPSSTNQPLTALPTNFDNLPNFTIIVPDLCGSMHDNCTGNKLDQGQAFMTQYIMNIYAYLKTHNGLLVVTFDEGNPSTDQHIWTAIAGPKVIHGSYSQSVDHYSWLRMFYQTMGLTNYAGGAASRSDISGCWASTARMTADNETKTTINVYPNPSTGVFKIDENGQADIKVYSVSGALVFDKKLNLPAEIDLSDQLPGIYTLSIGERRMRLVRF